MIIPELGLFVRTVVSHPPETTGNVLVKSELYMYLTLSAEFLKIA